jgi:hypothetical protein
METELLNEYLFANMLSEWAADVRTRRVKAAREAGTMSDAEATAVVTSSEDVSEAFRLFERRRREALALLQEEQTKFQGPIDRAHSRE